MCNKIRSILQKVNSNLILGAYGFGLLLIAGCTVKKIPDEPRKLNVILLVTDDQRWDALGYAGNEIIHTPNLNELAKEGVYFKNAFVTTSICCVSRASILSGQYQSRHKINDFNTPFSDTALALTYPVMLRKAGYRTGFVGKYGVGNKEDHMPKAQFDYWKGFRGQGSYNYQNEDGSYQHLTSKLGEQAREFLQIRDERPFCLSVSFKAGHIEGKKGFVPDPVFDSLYAKATIPAPHTAGDKYFEAFPDFFKKNNEGRTRWKGRFSTPEMYQKNVKKYYRLISGVDREVGLIRRELAELGLADNTVIIFTSDNGFYLGEHGLAGKWFGHEESIRVPMIFYDPRLDKGESGTRVEMILNIDLAPTILSLAGVDIPDTMQGKDFTVLFDDKSPSWRRDFFYEHHFGFKGKIPQSEGVVEKRYKYLRYITANPEHEVLYDLALDPNEINNFATDPRYDTILQRLRLRWGFLRNEVK